MIRSLPLLRSFTFWINFMAHMTSICITKNNRRYFLPPSDHIFFTNFNIRHLWACIIHQIKFFIKFCSWRISPILEYGSYSLSTYGTTCWFLLKGKVSLKPWSSRMDYFENNRQNLSSHLELVILENSRYFACYLSHQ